MPRSPHLDHKLPDMLSSIREARGISLRELARICGLNATTIWKVEKGFRIKAKILRRILTDGLGIAEGSKEWHDAIAAWTSEQAGRGYEGQELEDRVRRVMGASSKDLAEWGIAMAQAARRLNSPEREALLSIARDPDVAEAITRIHRAMRGK